MKESINWAVIRETDKEEWIDVSSLSSDRSTCEIKASALTAHIPHWAKDNPIKRFARVEVKEA